MLIAERNGMAKKSSHVEPVGMLCFTAEAANSTISLDKSNSALSSASLETSYNGITWSDYNWNNTTGDTLTLDNVGDTVYMRAKTENTTFSTSSSNYFKFVMTGRIAAGGTIMTLLKADGSRTDAPSYCFFNLFFNCTSLTQAPVLPAETLAYACYNYMFRLCTSLTQAPALPAETLAYACYSGMFRDCTSLTQAPALPAKMLADYCYLSMFRGCTSLAQAPAILPATTLATECYREMFYDCRALKDAPRMAPTTLNNASCRGMFDGCWNLSSIDNMTLPALTTTQNCYRSLFSNCRMLTTVGNLELPAKTLAYYCYQSMFYQCSSLIDAPALPATTLATDCYKTMFYHCSNLTSMDVSFESWSTKYTTNWLDGVSESGTFICKSTLPDERGASYIPNGWTKVDK